MGLERIYRKVAALREENETRGAALLVASLELAFEHEERDKRIAELVMANRELAFQHEETQKRAKELIAANVELVLQNNEKEKRSKELSIAHNSLKQFKYIVSHNLRAPIAKILGLASIMETDSPENKFLIEKVFEEATSLDSMIRDINTIVAGRHSEQDQLEMVGFESKLHQVRKVLSVEIAQSGAVITTDFAKAPKVFTVKCYLYSILYNLLSNAIKFRLLDGPLRIHIQTTQDEKFVCLSVQDNGRGIDLIENEDKIFGLYRRFHEDTIPGKGVGLKLVKTYTESIGGTVEVESKINGGTIFKIYIPNIISQSTIHR
jgi:light-regulated signal transduction histidine kinase (bacteriophytochrome)